MSAVWHLKSKFWTVMSREFEKGLLLFMQSYFAKNSQFYHILHLRSKDNQKIFKPVKIKFSIKSFLNTLYQSNKIW